MNNYNAIPNDNPSNLDSQEKVKNALNETYSNLIELDEMQHDVGQSWSFFGAKNHPDIVDTITDTKNRSEKLKEEFRELLSNFLNLWWNKEDLMPQIEELRRKEIIENTDSLLSQ